MESTAGRLEETIGRMRASVTEIRGTEIRIQRISTNATIRAIHIGEAGIALNKIAEVMQRLALESNTNSDEVARTLDEMSDAASRVSGRLGNAASGAHSINDQVVEEMRRTVGELHSSSECSFSRVSQIVALGARLAGDIGAVRSGFSARGIFAETVLRVLGELEEIGAQGSSGGVPVALTQALDDFGKNYTMQRERDVHQAVSTGSALPAAPTEAQKAAPEDGGLGANVELF
jgi:hypothetical protein